jgi:hypothetical protein
MEVEVRLRLGSKVEPGRQSVKVVSSKSRSEDVMEGDSVELRAVPSDMAAAGGEASVVDDMVVIARAGFSFHW